MTLAKTLHKKMKFSIGTFAEETLNRKLHFLSSEGNTDLSWL